jgi:hypothetical protein
MHLARALAIAGAAAAASGATRAATLHVPGGHPTIAAAIQAAASGDTVLVASGTYLEHDIVLASGVAVLGESGDPRDVTIDAEGKGRGFVSIDDGASTILAGFTITGAFTTSHGGGLYGVRSDLVVADCRFLENRSGNWGGGTAFQETSSPTILRCLFEENEGNFAGGMYCEGGSPLLRDCEFVRNRAIHTGGGFLSFAPASTPLLERCVFFANEALFANGGAISANYGSPTLSNCTLHLNSAPGFGGAIHALHGSVVTVKRSILSFSPNAASVWCSASASIDMVCCDVFGNEEGDWTSCIEDEAGRDGNFSADPLFCDGATGELTLRSDSPCAAVPGGCGLVGALGVGCGPTSLTPESWGRIKAAFRSP